MSVSLQQRAKAQLGLSDKYPDSLLAKTYLKELEAHLARYPFDYNFSLVKQIRKGYGVLTCRDDGCGTEINLTPLPDIRDGGRSIGVGSLSAFQRHIETHPTHKKSCLRRVAKEAGQAIELPAPELARGSMLTRNASRRVSEQQPFTASLAPSNSTRKRHSDSTFENQALEEDVAVFKKVKQEPRAFEMPKSPLATKTNLVAVTADRKVAPTPSMDAEESRHGVKRPADTEAGHDRLARKCRFSAADVMRVGRVKADLDDIRREGDQSTDAPLKKEPAMASSIFGTSLPAPLDLEDIKPRLQATANRPLPLPASIAAPLTTNNAPRTAVPPRMAPEHVSSQPLSMSRTAHNSVPDQPVPPNHTLLAATTSSAQEIAQNYRQSSALQQQPNAVAGPSRNPAPSTANPFLNARVKTEAQGDHSKPFGLVRPSANAAPLVEAEPVNAEYQPAGSSRVASNPAPAPVASSSTGPMAVAAHKLPAPFHYPGGMDLDSSDDEDYDMDHRLEILANMTADDMIDMIGINVPASTVDERDDDGLYYGRGRDLYIGPQAQVGDLNQFLILAGNAEQFDSSASIGDALEKLGLQHLSDPLPGMTVPLMAHQAIGVAWMVDKEKSPLKGGCLADEMGLGKTIQMIAAMSMNPPTDPALKATLIVTPLGLLDQWKLEIETKTNSDLKVLIYHGPNRPRRKEDLLKHDIVLTTFSTMANEWPDYEKQAKEAAKAKKTRKTDGFIVHDDDERYIDKVPRRKQESGLLFQVEFWRIVLDEAQNIRNRTTRASRAAGELRANHRWCLTGTPIINSLTDVYGYVRFLKIRPWYDWNHFNGHIARKEKKNPKLAISRLQAVIATYQIRRTKESMLDGKRLIELPPREVSMTQLEFSEEERQIYKMVEARSQAIFNRYLRQGTVLKNYHQILVLLLRLRQVCSHPCLIQEEIVAFVPKDQVDDTVPEPVTEVTRARKLVSPEFAEAMQRHFKEKLAQRMEAEKQSADAALEDEDCPICFEIMSDTAVFTACKHVFCRECIVGYLDTPLVNKNNDNGDDHPCPKCRAPVARNMLFSRVAFEPSDETSDDESDEAEGSDMDVDEPTTLKGKGKARPSRSCRKKVQYYDDDDDDMSDFIVEDDEDEEEKDARRTLKKRLGKSRSNVIIDSDDEIDTPEEQEVLIGKKTREELEKAEVENMSKFLPSTKMKYMMSLLEKNFEKKPDEKILIISQWTSCLTLVSDYLSEKGVIHVKYQGDMNREKRDQTVRAFMSKDKARVMLMSSKCGGVGLNLTRANNVICLDLAWSRAVESQAWDRVHRLGQSRPVNIQRLVIENTVEDRILRLQERKQLLADGSLGEGTGKKLGRLTVGELANLFGLDHRGNLLSDDQKS